MRVADWMQRKPITIKPQETLRAAWELLRQHRIRHLPVVEKGRLVGIVTDRDLRQALPSRAVSLEIHEFPQLAGMVRIWEVMTRVLITVSPETSIQEATCLLLKYRIGSLPVVRGERLVGIVTNTDLLKALLRYAEKAPSRPRPRRSPAQQPRRRPSAHGTFL